MLGASIGPSTYTTSLPSGEIAGWNSRPNRFVTWTKLEVVMSNGGRVQSLPAIIARNVSARATIKDESTARRHFVTFERLDGCVAPAVTRGTCSDGVA
jgi:hypothetical protein